MDIDKYFRILQKIHHFFLPENSLWEETKTNAIYQNHWWTKEFIDLKTQLITSSFFTKENNTRLEKLFLKLKNQKIAIVIDDYNIFSGIYELLMGFGLDIEIKCLPHHKILLEPIVQILNQEKEHISFVERLSKNYDFYFLYKKEKPSNIAKFYFEKYSHSIEHPQRGIAILEGNESEEKLQILAKHIFSFLGKENLNVAKILVPKGYDMNILFKNFQGYAYLKNHTHYALQYDYHLATIILQKKLYFTNELITIVEEKKTTSPISVLSFEYYTDTTDFSLLENDEVSYILKANDLQENTMQELERKKIRKVESQYFH